MPSSSLLPATMFRKESQKHEETQNYKCNVNSQHFKYVSTSFTMLPQFSIRYGAGVAPTVEFIGMLYSEFVD